MPAPLTISEMDYAACPTVELQMRMSGGLKTRLGRRRGPLHYADHHGDFIVVLDADLGVGVAWGTEGTQECDVLFQLGQGCAVGKGPLDLTRIIILGSHGHHLRGIERVRERGPPNPGRAAES